MNAKVQVKTLESIINNTELKSLLEKGDFLNYELKLRSLINDLSNEISEILIKESALKVMEELKLVYTKLGFKGIVPRPMEIQLYTGKEVKIPGYYAKRVPENYKGNRHLLGKYWGIIANGSPLYVSQLCLCSSICPSYDVGNELLMNFGLIQSPTRLRNVTNKFASFCYDKEYDFAVEEGETFEGFNVVIEIDGGRTCIREWNTKISPKGHRCYTKRWKEPKLFVLRVLDNEGNISKYHRPFYGVRFGEDDLLELLKKYLIKLKIKMAKSVQLVADGAPWIWLRIPELLEELGLEEEKLTKTLDYFHAVKYVETLVTNLPRKGKRQKEQKRIEYKELLWNGKSDQIVEDCKEYYLDPSSTVLQAMNYLEKHVNKTQFTDYQENNKFCGSGMVESAIRRVVNLRFKNPSTFWELETVEKLYFLRSSFLCKRWNTVLSNVVKAA